MLLGIAEDFTTTTTLDSQLKAVPDSGLYYNSGVHPSVNLDNLLHFLPNIDFTFTDYAAGTTYGKYEDTRKRDDIVLSAGNIYQSLTTNNTGNTPASNPTNWLETDIDSLRLKRFIQTVEDRAKGDINLVRRQIDSQYLYNIVEQNDNITASLLPNDYAAWIFEPKGSDYTTITLNQIALQATTATPQSLYVINQGQLITILTLNPNLEGRLVFEETNYTFSGKGKWIFAIDSQNVLLDSGVVDPLKYDGFVPYTATGIGSAPEDAVYSRSTSGNGLSFNISVHLDPAVYLDNNLRNFGQYLQSCFELSALNMYVANANNRVNRQERIQMSEQLLLIETRELNHNTSAKRYEDNRKAAVKMLEKTFDREISSDDDDLSITISSY